MPNRKAAFFYVLLAYSAIFERLILRMNDLVKNRVVIGLFFLFYIIILPRQYMLLDYEFWTQWALQIHRQGITHIYDNLTGELAVNYHPGFLYGLYLYTLVQGTEANIIAHIHYIKLIPLFFDFLPILVLCCFRQKLLEVKIPYLFLLLNIAYLFNSMIWGQVDSIHTNLVFLALLVAFYYPAWSIVLFIIAVSTKLQAIIFLPVLLLIYLYSIRNIKQLASVLIAGVLAQTIIVLPFIIAGKLDNLWHVVTHAVGFYPNVSVGAFNIWYLFMHDPYHAMDTEKLLFLSYRHWGLLLFALSSGVVLFPLLFRIYRLRLWKGQVDNATKQLLFLAGGLVSLYFFYFNTQMHERYAHPIIIFFFFYGVLSKNYKLYILASIPYFLSLEKLFPNYLPIPHYKIIFAMKVIAIWYTLTIIYGTYLFFKNYNIREEYRLLKTT